MSSEIDFKDTVVPDAPPKEPSDTRWKRRRSYTRKDGRFGWVVDVTEVVASSGAGKATYEIEVELNREFTKKLVKTQEREELDKLVSSLSVQLLWIIENLAPVENDLEVADFLQVRILDNTKGDTVAMVLRSSQANAHQSEVKYTQNSTHGAARLGAS
jgi:hypothetical protein